MPPPSPRPVRAGGFPRLFRGSRRYTGRTLAAALRVKYKKPLVILCPDEASANAIAGDVAALTGETCTALIARDYVFYSADAMSRSGEQRRINALSFMMNGEGITVATAEGFFERTMPPEVFRRSVFEIDMHSTVAPEDVEDALLRCGYSRAVQTEGPGQFSRRGGIIDFFSPAHSQPVRIEFWGDEIDSMGFFDTGTQRRTESIEKCVVVPAAEMLPSLAKGWGPGTGRRAQPAG